MTREEWGHNCKVQNQGASGQNAFAVCMADWDAATHMSNQEWRNACLRSVKEDPTAFHRPAGTGSRAHFHAGVVSDRLTSALPVFGAHNQGYIGGLEQEPTALIGHALTGDLPFPGAHMRGRVPILQAGLEPRGNPLLDGLNLLGRDPC